MKPKLSIPKRIDTPRPIDTEAVTVSDLWHRMMLKQTVPGDEFLIMKYQERLDDITRTYEWHMKQRQDKMDWQDYQYKNTK